MKLLLHILFFFFIVMQICFGQLERQYEATDNWDRLDYLFRPGVLDSTQLDSIINQRMSAYHIPGLTALVTKKEGGIAWKKNFGLANIAQNKPVEDSTLFLIASVSKIIVATAIMQFWESDSFDLDDNINDYLDNFQISNPYFPNDTITIRMLLTHTSSLRDYGNWDFLYTLETCGDTPIALDSFLINYLTPGGIYYSALSFYNFAPGTAWEYASVDLCVLAHLVEKFSGMSLNQYCRENIFDPLEMHKSSFLLAELDTNEIATPYLWTGSQYVPYCHRGHPITPASFLRTNKIELEHFLSAYMNWGKYNGATILDSLTVDLILTDQLGYPVPGDGDYQGLIWYQSGELNGRFPWGHTGGWWGCNTGMFFKQEEDWGIICFMNSFVGHIPLMDMLNLLSDYAHLYGNVYALHPSIDKPYAKVNVDSVLFRTRFSNINNHPFTANLIFTNTNSTIIDSLSIFDDGQHGDSLFNDGIYGNYIPPISIEDFFKLSVSTIDHQTNKYFSTPVDCKFTTAGPVIVDRLYGAFQPAQLRFAFRPYLINPSTKFQVLNPSVIITCNDSMVTNITPNKLTAPTILPGQRVACNGVTSIYYDPSKVKDSLTFNIHFEIYSDGFAYWNMDTTISFVLTGIEEEQVFPTSYKLNQNYPNPFNPTTSIQYSIASRQFVTLKVYDVLGTELEILVNEEKPVGIYELNWDATNLPSGVYFYQLRAGDFIQAKKMILIK